MRTILHLFVLAKVEPAPPQEHLIRRILHYQMTAHVKILRGLHRLEAAVCIYFVLSYPGETNG